MANRPLGKRQRDLLVKLGSPTRFLLNGSAAAKSLARVGLVKSHGNDGDSFYAITPAGLRALADEMIAGRIKQELQMKDSANG